MNQLFGDISPWNQPQKKDHKPQLNSLKSIKKNIIISQTDLRKSLPSNLYYFEGVIQTQKNNKLKKNKQSKLSPLKVLKNRISQYQTTQQKFKRQYKSYIQNSVQKKHRIKQYDIPLVKNTMLKYSNLKLLQSKSNAKNNLSVPNLMKKITESPTKQEHKPSVLKNDFFVSKSQLFKDKMMQTKMPKCNNIIFDYKQQFVSLKMNQMSPNNKRRSHILDILLGEKYQKY